MTEQLQAELAQFEKGISDITAQMRQVIVGQEDVMRLLKVGLLSGGHCLLQGVPGVAKTLMARTLATSMSLEFSRVQFTPDLMPSDIIGTDVLQSDDTGGRRFEFEPGPVFTQILLADEINRAPPKTQAALLEAMQEGAVTFAGKTHSLPKPFFVLATQNPVEQSGTYPLPEAELDRFLLMIRVPYPTADEEERIIQSTTGPDSARVKPVIDAETILHMQGLVRQVVSPPPVLAMATRLVRSTRPDDDRTDDSGDFVRQYVRWGAGPRAGQALILAAKAVALMDGRFAATRADAALVASAVIEHRLVLDYRAEVDGITAHDVVTKLVEASRISS